MENRTSKRHTEILNGYQQGDSVFNEWVQDKLGKFRLTEWSWGRLSMEWDIDDRCIMPDGVMFGGHVAAVADHIVGLVSMTVLADSDERFRTSRLETNFFRPVMKPSLRIEARVTNLSRTLIHAEADYLTPADKLAARIYAVQVRRPQKGDGRPGISDGN